MGDKNILTEKERAERNDVNDPYQDLQKTKLSKHESIDYEEEDSYLNPSNISKVNQSNLNDMSLGMQQNVSIINGIPIDCKRDISVDTNPYLSKRFVPKRYDNINNSNMLFDGGDGQQSDNDSQIINQSLYDDQN